MSRLIVFSLAMACAACTEAIGGTAEVKLVDCPKCDRRLRIAPDGKSATVNLSRLVDDMPDEATKNRRIEEMTVSIGFFGIGYGSIPSTSYVPR